MSGCAARGSTRPACRTPGAPVRSVKAKGETAELSGAEAALATDGFAALRSLLDSYHRHYERLKAERSGADFEDLELRALELLQSPGTVSAAWRERFEHLMVDEFQDTNGVQLALIDALRGPQTRLFVVGDEFQSIYRFRHADLEVFRRRRREASRDQGTVERPLRGNFRSGPEVLAAVNLAGSALLGDFTPLEAGREASGEPAGGVPGAAAEPRGAPATELLLTDVSDDKAGQPTGWRAEGIELDPPDGEGSPAYVAEARFLAHRLRELADAGVPRGDMVVLLRAFTHVDAYEEALERAGLAPYVVGGRGYWSQQQVEDALRLLGVVANPLDDELLFGALASPACGVSPDALWLLRQAARAAERRRPARVADRRGRRVAGDAPRRGRPAPRPVQGDPRPAPKRGSPAAARLADRPDDLRLRLRPGPAGPPGRAAAHGQRAQADAPGRRVRGARGPRPSRLSGVRRGAHSARRPGGHGRGPGGGTRRGPGDDGACGQGARVPGGRGGRSRARARGGRP